MKLIVCDLDGTLLTHDLKIAETDREALQKANESGIEIAIASGRMYPDISRIMSQLDIKGCSVGQNGASVYSKTGELIAEKTFDPELFYDLYHAGRKLNSALTTLICTHNQIIIEKHSDESLILAKKFLSPILEDHNIISKIGAKVHPSKLTFLGSTEAVLDVKVLLESLYGDHIEVTLSESGCIDVMPKGITKGAGLSKLMNRLNIPVQEMACIGDSYNDLSMFDLTPYSFVMNQSPDDVKARANYQVSSVADAVHRLLDETFPVK
ncbi:Cof subfamily protein (haloacid dehalogenase superfamily) [Scopulibacillus daqui]|uniref:Cof subfamily protein (Haloacid dehalogenase superfamily) n=1 Tax=Scopulibacillus daqui TaxID=1469162 RepID=A0ABS2Q1J2_9BACL|nr:Cof-type HAD-IIB family hydrolase [Scopulibacillus daqui]MBM7646160.1 Cof subfamily protein (haloacid dehalogenase superfamily) [Scopulibacillus daqui]